MQPHPIPVCSQDERESPLQSSPASKEEKSSKIHHSLYTEMDHTKYIFCCAQKPTTGLATLWNRNFLKILS